MLHEQVPRWHYSSRHQSFGHASHVVHRTCPCSSSSRSVSQKLDRCALDGRHDPPPLGHWKQIRARSSRHRGESGHLAEQPSDLRHHRVHRVEFTPLAPHRPWANKPSEPGAS